MKNHAVIGRFVILSGHGKGKTTSALGMTLRAVGRGQQVAFVQFLKEEASGEHTALLRSPEVDFYQGGGGFVRGAPTPEQEAMVRKTLEASEERLLDSRYGMVVLDEILTAWELGLVSVDDLCKLVEAWKNHQECVHDWRGFGSGGRHLIMTGRAHPSLLRNYADTITCMHQDKHPLDVTLPVYRYCSPGIEI